jgi:hypothetical protein
LGAACGGVIASKLGNSACFLIDAVTYLLASWFAFQVPLSLGDPHAMERNTLKKHRSTLVTEDMYAVGGGAGAGIRSLSGAGVPPGSSANAKDSAPVRDIELAEVKLGNEHHLHGVEHRKGAVNQGETAVLLSSSIPSPPVPHYLPTQSLTAAHSGNSNRDGSGSVGINLTPAHSGSSIATTITTIQQQGASSSSLSVSSFQSTAEAVWRSCLGGWSAAVEGWRYLGAPENRDVAALVIMKGCGSITWGAVDVLNVKFSEIMPVGDSSTTLGLIFATVGVGCFLGPIFLNALVEPRPKPLLWASALAFIFLFAGAVVMAAARKLYLVLIATLIRAVGSATLWIYSTLLLQLRCPNAILGRVSAAEMAFYTVCEAVSSLYGGAAFDLFGFSLEKTTASLAVVAGFVAVGWIAYAWRQQQVLELRSNGSGSYKSDGEIFYGFRGGAGDEEERSPLTQSQ